MNQTFFSNSSQLRDFGAQALPSKYLDICVVCSSTQAFQKELGSYQRSVDAATASGKHLVAEVLDDPTGHPARPGRDERDVGGGLREVRPETRTS